MATEKDIEHYLYKNVSYLFSISVYDTPLKYVLKEYIIDTYLYYTEDTNIDRMYILLKKECIDLLEEKTTIKYPSSTKYQPRKFGILGFIDYEVIDDYIVVSCDLATYFSSEELYHIENSDYNNLIEYELYTYVKNLDFHKSIVESDNVFKDLLEDFFKSNVNHYWKKYDKEKETLSLVKIRDMSTRLEINKAWLQTKITNSSLVAKLAYEDVYNNSKEIIAPSVIALGNEPDFYMTLHKKLQDKLKEKTGKTQFNIDIKGTKFPILCSSIDLKSKLSKVITKYKLTDMDKIEKLLLIHIGKLKAPMLKYYIDKDNSSALAGDYETYEESVEVPTNSFEI